MTAGEDEGARSDARLDLEAVGAFVKVAIVKCEGFRCLAYLGRDGKWRSARGQVLEVEEVVDPLQ
jgi:hypothetical protein